jgi:hypothetical protein
MPAQIPALQALDGAECLHLVADREVHVGRVGLARIIPSAITGRRIT